MIVDFKYLRKFYDEDDGGGSGAPEVTTETEPTTTDDVSDSTVTETETEPESDPEPVDLPDWLNDVMAQRNRPEPEPVPEIKEPDFSESTIDKPDIDSIRELIQAEVSKVRQDSDEKLGRVNEALAARTENAVRSTVGYVKDRLYKGAFSKDSDFRTNENLRAAVDHLVKQNLSSAIMRAREFGDDEGLRFIHSNVYADAVLALARVGVGASGSVPKEPLKIKGDHIESKRPARVDSTGGHTAEELEIMKEYDIDPAQNLKDRKDYMSDVAYDGDG
jgi:hypothetical protein